MSPPATRTVQTPKHLPKDNFLVVGLHSKELVYSSIVITDNHSCELYADCLGLWVLVPIEGISAGIYKAIIFKY